MKKQIPVFVFLSTFVLLVLFACSGGGNTVINFPDPNFEAAVRYAIEKPTGAITRSDIAAVTTLDLADREITDLSGIEYFTALTELKSDGNQLTSLDVSKNTVLTKLNCSTNQLTSLDVSKNTALTDLYCYTNQLTSLDVSNNTALTNLSLGGNQLTSLDVSKNTALTDLSLKGNSITNKSAIVGLDERRTKSDFVQKRSGNNNNSGASLFDFLSKASRINVLSAIGGEIKLNDPINKNATYTITDTTKKHSVSGNVYSAPMELMMSQNVQFVNIQNPQKVRYGCKIRILTGTNALGVYATYKIFERGTSGTVYTVVDAVVID